MSKFPLTVSVIIPTYNYADKILFAIESILAQDYPSNLIEIVVVDDGSTDHTEEVIKPLLRNNNIKYHLQSNLGKASATALAIKIAKGDIIFNLDADDIYESHCISQKINIYNSYPDVSMVSNPAKITFQDSNFLVEQLPKFMLGQVIQGIDILNSFYSNNIFYGGGSTFSCRKSVFDIFEISNSADMYIDELLVLYALKNNKGYFIQEALTIWNVHSNNYSIKKKVTHCQTDRLIKSSISVLDCLKKYNFPSHIINIYDLKHQIRLLSFKENTNLKSLSDIFQFIKFLKSKRFFNFRILKKYHVFNRLIPIDIYRYIKDNLA